MLQKILLGDLMFRPKHGNNAAVVLGLISSISSRLSFRSMKERSPQQRHQRPKERSGLPFQQKTLHTTSKRKKWLEQRRKNGNKKSCFFRRDRWRGVSPRRIRQMPRPHRLP